MLASFILGGMLAAAPVAILVYERRSRRAAAEAAYHEAATIGLATTRVERDLPSFGHGYTRVRFVAGTCAQSTVPLRRNVASRAWSFRVTERRGGMAGDGWWHLREDEGELPPAVVMRLSQEVDRLEYTGGFLDFAGTADEVTAWWDDTLGPDEARRVAVALRDIAHLLEQDGVAARNRMRA